MLIMWLQKLVTAHHTGTPDLLFVIRVLTIAQSFINIDITTVRCTLLLILKIILCIARDKRFVSSILMTFRAHSHDGIAFHAAYAHTTGLHL